MFLQTATVDKTGRIALPQQILDALGIQEQGEVIIEVTDTGVLLKPKQSNQTITERIAAMNLPVDDWEHMEQEIEDGRLTYFSTH